MLTKILQDLNMKVNMVRQEKSITENIDKRIIEIQNFPSNFLFSLIASLLLSSDLFLPLFKLILPKLLLLKL